MNKSFTYLLPLYCKYLKSENSELTENLFIEFLKECYCYNKVDDQLKEQFILQLNKPKEKNNIFQKYLSNLKKSSIFKGLTIAEEYYFIYLNIPKELSNDYINFINGRYSEFENDNKIIVLKSSKDNVSLSFSAEINQIFSKSPQRREELEKKLNMKIPRDIELSSIPDTLSETFKL